jgi:hypothetical protein
MNFRNLIEARVHPLKEDCWRRACGVWRAEKVRDDETGMKLEIEGSVEENCWVQEAYVTDTYRDRGKMGGQEDTGKIRRPWIGGRSVDQKTDGKKMWRKPWNLGPNKETGWRDWIAWRLRSEKWSL